ncbi:MAG TPA: DUF6266 family protein [Pedobacter sp.]|uniref:DUF6266 family protein n=1 Tax=Pedobacter sp. TaxID=1411316 RepID=UPI002BAD050B|nr:DUF6266 family protein [Pedobacter sp.]HMI01775.1 DUF6266 family protein [Pedobacter sp.]
MARMFNGMAGLIQGKIGNLVYYVKNGKQMVRKAGKMTKPPTLPQLQNRMELAVAVAFLRPLTEFINVGFIVGQKDYNNGKTSYNLAVAYNKPNAVMGLYPDVVMDFTKVLVANGNMDMAMLPSMVLTAEGIRFDWLCPDDTVWPRLTDEVMMLAYFPDLAKAVYVTSGAKRSACTDLLALPEELLAEYMEVYISFVANDRKAAARSIYLGRFNKVPG